MKHEKFQKEYLQLLIEYEIERIKKLVAPQIDYWGNLRGRIPAGLDEIVGRKKRGYRIRRRYGFTTVGRKDLPQHRVSYLVTPRLEALYALTDQSEFKSRIAKWSYLLDWYNNLWTGRELTFPG